MGHISRVKVTVLSTLIVGWGNVARRGEVITYKSRFDFVPLPKCLAALKVIRSLW